MEDKARVLATITYAPPTDTCESLSLKGGGALLMKVLFYQLRLERQGVSRCHDEVFELDLQPNDESDLLLKLSLAEDTAMAHCSSQICRK